MNARDILLLAGAGGTYAGVAYRKPRSPKPEDAARTCRLCHLYGREECAIANGKYQEWLTEDGLLTVEGWAREGLTDAQIAAKMRISTQTLYEWRNRFPDFMEALKKGKAPVDTKVENALLKRALGYDYVETVTEYTFSETEKDENGEPKRIMKSQKTTRKHVPGEVGAQAFWLKNRRPDRWREKREEQIQVTEADYSLLDDVKGPAEHGS